jgi:peptide/nickel transport system substrate-binding protein
VIIELKQAKFTFRYILAMCFTAVVPRDLVARYGGDFQYHLAGSGPYRVAEWKRNIRWRLERNPFYTGTDGLVDQVEIMIGPDPSLCAMMLEHGELDRMTAGPAEAARFRRDPRLRAWVQSVDTSNTDYLYFNTEMKPFSDVRVRRAMNHAVNRERLIKLAGGLGVPARGIIPPAMPWTNPSLHLPDYNPAKARELLREAGYPNGFATELWYEINRSIDVRVCAGIQQDLHEVGVEAELRPATVAAFEVKVRSRRQVACGYWGWMEDYPDPSDFLDVLLNGDRITEADCNNVAFYNNPEVNRRLAWAGNSIDAAERQTLFREAEQLVVQDAPWAPILHEQLPVINHPRLHGTDQHPVWLWRYEKMWLDP